MNHFNPDPGTWVGREKIGYGLIALPTAQALVATLDQDRAGFESGAEPWTDCTGGLTMEAEVGFSG